MASFWKSKARKPLARGRMMLAKGSESGGDPAFTIYVAADPTPGGHTRFISLKLSDNEMESIVTFWLKTKDDKTASKG